MVANIVFLTFLCMHYVASCLYSLSVLSAANAPMVECQTLDQSILYKTFHSVHVTTIQCLGYTLNFNM